MDEKLIDAVKFLLNQMAAHGDGASAPAARQHLANLAVPAIPEIAESLRAKQAPHEESVDPD